MAGRIEGALTVIGKDDHAAFVGGVASRDEELGLEDEEKGVSECPDARQADICRCFMRAYHVSDILSTTSKGGLLTLVVDANEEGFLPSSSGPAVMIDLLLWRGRLITPLLLGPGRLVAPLLLAVLWIHDNVESRGWTRGISSRERGS